jgi:cell wall-associated NlpC family hydrolase
MTATATQVLAHAKKFVDEKYAEEGDNHTIMGKWFGTDGQPWCAAFVSYCFHLAGSLDLIKETGKKGFASCDLGLKAFAKSGKLVPVGQAKRGDIVFFQFDTDAQPDHVGFVYSNDGKNLICFEGNTSPDGVKGSQSNGGMCAKKKRPYSLVMAVARPIYTAE